MGWCGDRWSKHPWYHGPCIVTNPCVWITVLSSSPTLMTHHHLCPAIHFLLPHLLQVLKFVDCSANAFIKAWRLRYNIWPNRVKSDHSCSAIVKLTGKQFESLTTSQSPHQRHLDGGRPAACCIADRDAAAVGSRLMIWIYLNHVRFCPNLAWFITQLWLQLWVFTGSWSISLWFRSKMDVRYSHWSGWLSSGRMAPLFFSAILGILSQTATLKKICFSHLFPM